MNLRSFGAGAARSQLRDDVTATIREMIVSGQVRPGELLRLGPLADQLGISITPVREALLLLAQDGWFIQEPNRGFRVAPIRRADLRDTYYVYGTVAGELAARAARNASDAAIARLRTLAARIEAIPDDPELAADLGERLNYELHHAIYVMADAPRLVWFVEAATRFVPRSFWSTIPGWPDFNRTGHQAIIDHIEKGDAEVARVLMSNHIHRAAELLERWLDSINFFDESLGESAE